MAGQLGVAMLDVAIDRSGMRQELSALRTDVETQAKQIGESGGRDMGLAWTEAWSKLQVARALLGPLKQFTKEAIALAGERAEAQNFVAQAFGNETEAIREWAKTATTSIVQSEIVTAKQAATLFLMAKNMGVAGDQATEMAKELTNLAGDLVSFKDLQPDEAFRLVQMALSGQGDELRRHGYALDAATIKQRAFNLGIAKQGEELNNGQRFIAAHSLLMQQASDALGDLERTQNEWVNSEKRMDKALDNLKEKFGEQIIASKGSKDAMQTFISLLSDEKVIADIQQFGRDIGDTTGAITKLVQALKFLKDMSDKSPLGWVNELGDATNILARANRLIDTMVAFYRNDLPEVARSMGSDSLFNPALDLMEKFGLITEKAAKKLRDLAQAAKEAGKAAKDMGDDGSDAAQKALEAYQEWWDQSVARTEELARANAKVFEDDKKRRAQMREELQKERDKELEESRRVVATWERLDERLKQIALDTFPKISQAIFRVQKAGEPLPDEIERWAEGLGQGLEFADRQADALVHIGEAARAGNVEAAKFFLRHPDLLKALDAELDRRWELLGPMERQRALTDKEIVAIDSISFQIADQTTQMERQKDLVGEIAEEWLGVVAAQERSLGILTGMQSFVRGIGDPLFDPMLRGDNQRQRLADLMWQADSFMPQSPGMAGGSIGLSGQAAQFMASMTANNQSARDAQRLLQQLAELTGVNRDRPFTDWNDVIEELRMQTRLLREQGPRYDTRRQPIGTRNDPIYTQPASDGQNFDTALQQAGLR